MGPLGLDDPPLASPAFMHPTQTTTDFHPSFTTHASMSANDYHLSYTRQQASNVSPPKDIEGGPTESSDEDDYGNRPAKRPRNFVARQVSRAAIILTYF